MRETKFRVWTGKRMITPALEFDDFDKPFTITDLVVIPEVNLKWMQYTGLKDKNGKEIYEGDWVKDGNESVGLVEWHDMGFVFQHNKGKGWLHPISSGMDGPTLEIIGNIYENPELL